MGQEPRPPGVVWVRIEEQAAWYLITVTHTDNVEKRAGQPESFASVDGAVEAVRTFLTRYSDSR